MAQETATQTEHSGQAETAHQTHEDSHSHVTGDHEDRHAGDGHDEHHATPSIWEDLAFWSIIAFAGFCFAIWKLGIWDWMLTSMSDRENQANELISTAEQHLAAANDTLAQVRGQLDTIEEKKAELLAEAGRDADYIRREIVEQAQRESKLMVQRTEFEINRVRDQALHNLFEHLSDRVTEVTEQRLRNEFQESDQDALIEQTLNQMARN